MQIHRKHNSSTSRTFSFTMLQKCTINIRRKVTSRISSGVATMRSKMRQELSRKFGSLVLIQLVHVVQHFNIASRKILFREETMTHIRGKLKVSRQSSPGV